MLDGKKEGLNECRRRRNKLWKERTDKRINYGRKDKINKEEVNKNEWTVGLYQWINDGSGGKKKGVSERTNKWMERRKVRVKNGRRNDWWKEEKNRQINNGLMK